MITSVGSIIVNVIKGKWNQPGSKTILLKFLNTVDPWTDCTLQLCEVLGVNVKDGRYESLPYSALLGSGANGRAFELEDGRVMKVVIGKNSEKVEYEYGVMKILLSNEIASSAVFPVVVDTYKQGLSLHQEPYAGYLLKQVGKPLSLPLNLEMKTMVAKTLYLIHKSGHTHGDPRIQNVLLVGNEVKWIDFRETEFVTTKLSLTKDVNILYSSIHSNISSLSFPSQLLEEYLKEQTEDKLISILTQE
jgi:tRNA A-37 threonylcarbamoyl transferase component Bud32